ncbi:hypothetical protein GJ744_001538 [Endocarpon pusillum]|uniref:Uncharacterized protein n=1 Tax=Endocarpon pusillum TaxID=364733 RepID=A0A8H7E0J9_9EURO|nr:hypothetical protein GJ744_001538 [Endocarpon pusillum]
MSMAVQPSRALLEHILPRLYERLYLQHGSSALVSLPYIADPVIGLKQATTSSQTSAIAEDDQFATVSRQC